jgi:DNA-directed RNA polymerase subunit RPC12/RpoP
MSDYYDDDHEPLEAYCVRCRQTVEVENPQPVWTRKGMPATRGECPDCGGTVFRMGRTAAHDSQSKPEAVEVSGGQKGPKLSQDTVYVLYAAADMDFASQIAEDLKNSGITAWLHEHDEAEVAWAGGVHPALEQCQRMLVILSPALLAETALESRWTFFREKRKPVIIAQIASADPPDAIRRSPRYDFAADYKRAFREMLQVLG